MSFTDSICIVYVFYSQNAHVLHSLLVISSCSVPPHSLACAAEMRGRYLTGQYMQLQALLIAIQSYDYALQAASDDITAADDTHGICADHDALQQAAARTAAVLPSLRTHSRRPGRAHSSQSLPGRLQASDSPNSTDDMVIA